MFPCALIGLARSLMTCPNQDPKKNVWGSPSPYPRFAGSNPPARNNAEVGSPNPAGPCPKSVSHVTATWHNAELASPFCTGPCARSVGPISTTRLIDDVGPCARCVGPFLPTCLNADVASPFFTGPCLKSTGHITTTWHNVELAPPFCARAEFFRWQGVKCK